MKIFAIVVYKLPSKDSISATLNSSIFDVVKLDPFEKSIRESIERDDGRNFEFLRDRKHYYHQISMNRVAGCAYTTDEKIMIVATDEPLISDDKHIKVKRRKLFANIESANSARDLMAIIANPEMAMKDKSDLKIDKVKEQIGEVKSVMLDNIDKMLARGEQVEDIVKDTEDLKRAAELFNQGAKRLKESQRCPGMWSIFTPIANAVGYVFGSNEVKYTYEAAEESEWSSTVKPNKLGNTIK